MYFTSRSVKLLAIGAAAALHSGPRQRETVYAFMQRAAEYGAKFYACPQALDEHGIAQADFDDHWPRLQSAARPTPALLEGMFVPKLATLRGLLSRRRVRNRLVRRSSICRGMR